MKNFWLSCGHILTNRDAGGGLVVTDELLKAYLARPELRPPLEACAAERRLHEALFEEPRRPVAGDQQDAQRQQYHRLHKQHPLATSLTPLSLPPNQRTIKHE